MQMPSHDDLPSRTTRPRVSALRGWRLSLATKSAPVAIGWWGHATHWSFGTGDCHSHDASQFHGGGHIG